MDARMWKRRGLFAVLGSVVFLVVIGTLISSFQWLHKPFPGFFLYSNLTVAPDFLPDWSGRKAGLRFLDRVIAIEGQPISQPKALYDLVRQRPARSTFEYTVEREGRTLKVLIPSMKFSFQDWLLSFGIYLLVGLGFLAIGVTPFYLRSPSPAAGPLFFMVCAIFMWFAATFDFMTTQLLPKEIRIFAFILTPSAGVHLGLLLTRPRDGYKRYRVYLALIYGTSILLGSLYGLTFYGPFELWQSAVRVAYGYSCLAALIFLVLLLTALRASVTELERSRLRVILVGAILGFFFPTFGTVLTSFFLSAIPYNLLLILAVFFPLSVAYALLKYSLFDLGMVLKVGLSRGALTGVLLLIYILVVSLLSISAGVYEKELWAPLFFSILVVLVFNPLLRWIEGVVDRALYQRDYDPAQLRSEVSRLLRSLSKPQAVGEAFLRLVTDRIGIGAAFLCFQQQDHETEVTIVVNRGKKNLQELIPELRSLWLRHFALHKKGVSKDELESDPFYQKSCPELLKIFLRLGSELLIPIVFEQSILGFLSFGKKRSQRGYDIDDFGLLCNLADQLALSLENGMLFEESEKAKENYRLLYDQAEGWNKKLIKADQNKKHFVANISHEIRTPVSTILGYAEVLLDPGFAGDSRAMVERIVANGRELSQLMDSLVDFSTMEADSLAATQQKIDLREMFESLETMALRLIKKRPIRFCVQDDLPMDFIESDPKKLQQILMQLLTNALKFTERGEIGVEIRPVPQRGESFVGISVSDTGIGISKRDQEIIFEEFRQLDGSSTRPYGGTGIGLSLCKRLAHSLGGVIEVESEVGRGSVFSLILPLRRSQAESAIGLQAA